METILDRILHDVRRELAAARAAVPEAALEKRLADAPPPRDFAAALRGGFGLIAEIKQCSPSVGAMRPDNVREAAAAYEEAPVVRALSVLTNRTHFGMGLEDLAAVRSRVSKPVLRKDFILDPYQVLEARAAGADAILLMANVLDGASLASLHALARSLGLAVLFEVHERAELDLLPAGAEIVGINSRKFKTREGFSGAGGHSDRDFSLDPAAFELVGSLPAGCLRVAESGVSAGTVAGLRGAFDAVLVGTSLLRDPQGVRAGLASFAAALDA